MKNKESKGMQPKSSHGDRKHSDVPIQVPKNAPTSSQVNRLKKFYYTTKWLPNSAFTTYFGKPAFENYGYGNVKPSNGGLFYGNYMLSHNINPVDGRNTPDAKQVYSSAMLKTLNNNKKRIPKPPRKTPDDIRNTPTELEEIKGRNPIFQLNNGFPQRDIKTPNLLKSRYFKSAKNSPAGTPRKSKRKETEEDESEFDINLVLENKIKTVNKGAAKKKKKVRDIETLKKLFSNGGRNKSSVDMSKSNANRNSPGKSIDDYVDMENTDNALDDEDLDENEEDMREAMMEEYLEKVREAKRESKNNMRRESSKGGNDNKKESKMSVNKRASKNDIMRQEIEEIYDEIKEEEGMKRRDSKNIIKKKSNKMNYVDDQDSAEDDQEIDQNKCVQRRSKNFNPCLDDPSVIKHNVICSNQKSDEDLTVQEKDPRNYKFQPPCMLEKIAAAGRPIKMSESVGNLLR